MLTTYLASESKSPIYFFPSRFELLAHRIEDPFFFGAKYKNAYIRRLPRVFLTICLYLVRNKFLKILTFLKFVHVSCSFFKHPLYSNQTKKLGITITLFPCIISLDRPVCSVWSELKMIIRAIQRLM